MDAGKDKRLTAESAEDAETIKFQNPSAKSQIIMNLQCTKIPINVFELEFGIYLVPRFAGLDIGIWDFLFCSAFSACSAVMRLIRVRNLSD
jgi:hypothetical protein